MAGHSQLAGGAGGLSLCASERVQTYSRAHASTLCAAETFDSDKAVRWAQKMTRVVHPNSSARRPFEFRTRSHVGPQSST